jgi:hypothetical protein
MAIQTVIVYPPGGFGSMLEAVLRRYSVQYQSLNEIAPADDGSFHNYSRGEHVFMVNDSTNQVQDHVYSVIYPGYNKDIPVAFDILESHKTQKVFVKIGNSFEMIQCWCLFDHKDDLLDPNNLLYKAINNAENLSSWGCSDYSELETWQKREHLSYVLDGIFEKTLLASTQAPDNWFVINFSQLLLSPRYVIRSLFDHYNLDMKDEDDFTSMINNWKDVQSPICARAVLITDIIHATLGFTVPVDVPELSIMEQAIIQQQLRQHGYEIKCQDLNHFPRTTSILKDIIYRLDK